MNPNNIEVIWARVNMGNSYNTYQYIIKEKDIGFQIKARIAPFDNNGTRFEYMEPRFNLHEDDLPAFI